MQPIDMTLAKKTGVDNFRELGGYTTTDGKTVRKGLLYRSGVLYKLSQANQAFLGTLGLRNLFDLRSKSEVAQKQDYIPADCVYHNVSGLPAMDETIDGMGGGNMNMRDMLKKAKGDPETVAMLQTYLPDCYRDMVRRPEAFQAIIRLLLDQPAQPILFHCTAGKDRTGFAAAVVLSVLGVSRETIIEDYMLSEYFRRAEIRRTMLLVGLMVRDAGMRDSVRAMLGTRTQFLLGAFDEMDKLYGGFDGFWTNGLGFSEYDAAQLRATYLQ